MPRGQEVVCHGCQSGNLAVPSASRFDRQHPCGNVMGRPSAPSHNSSCHIISYRASQAVTAAAKEARTSAGPGAAPGKAESGDRAEGAEGEGCHRGPSAGIQPRPRLALSRNGVSSALHAHMAEHRRAGANSELISPVDMPSYNTIKNVHRGTDDIPTAASSFKLLEQMLSDSLSSFGDAVDRTSRSCLARLPSWYHHRINHKMYRFTCGIAPIRALWLAIWICLILAPIPSVARAAPRGPVVGAGPENPGQSIDGVDFMRRFGYLPQSDMETGALRTEEEMQKAIRKFQAYAQIPITGLLDKTTLDKMASPRCGVADNVGSVGKHVRGKRYVAGPSKWEESALTFRILNYSPDLDISDIRDSIIRAFQLWQEVTQLTFHEVMQGNADIMIKFARGYHGDGYRFDGPGMILAHAFFPGEDKGGDMHFDDDETWTVRQYDGTNLYAVAAHELGHALGLAHSSVMGSLMYPWYQGYNPNLQLHADDIAGIQYLYGYKNTPIRTTTASTYDPHPGPTRYPTRAPVTSFPTIVPTTTRALPTIPPRTDQAPDPCTSSIDAISLIRGEIYAFKGRWFWRIDETGVMQDYPVELNRFWYGLPDDLEGIDAVYERDPGDGKIIFFKKNRYWSFSGNRLQNNFSKEGRPITDLGFPKDIDHIDAAFIWGHNKKTYFISGDMYWKYNEYYGHMEYDYPRDMSMWAGVPLPVDGAFTDSDGITFFLKGLEFWEFNNVRMKAEDVRPPPLIGPMWLECKEPVMRNDGVTGDSAYSSKPSLISFFTLLIISTVVQKIQLLDNR